VASFSTPNPTRIATPQEMVDDFAVVRVSECIKEASLGVVGQKPFQNAVL
jgi:7,8-dihydro-6-hydroxymethylpterin-pyrophosphokinase